MDCFCSIGSSISTPMCSERQMCHRKPILVVLIMRYLELWCRTISELIAMCNAKSIHDKMLKKKTAKDQTLEYFSLLFTRIS